VPNHDSDVRCLYCLRSDGGFATPEHPIPESIGNSEVILPPGVVCDRCNGGVLSVLDQTLGDFFLLKIRRTTLGVKSKTGKVPVTIFHDGRLIHNGQFAALVGDLHRRSWDEEKRSNVDPRYTIGMATLSGGRPVKGRQAEDMSRALLKVGYGCAWIDQREQLMDAEFDDVRDVILGAKRRPGYIFVGSEIDERNTGLNVWYTCLRDHAGNTWFRVFANLYGVRMVTDSRDPLPPPNMGELRTTVTFNESSPA
jgi:hypothetical protein